MTWQWLRQMERTVFVGKLSYLRNFQNRLHRQLWVMFWRHLRSERVLWVCSVSRRDMDLLAPVGSSSPRFLELLAGREMLTINHRTGPKVTGITHLAWCLSCGPASHRQPFTSISSAIARLSLSASFPITHKLCKSRGGNEDPWRSVPVLSAITARGWRELEALVFLLAGLEISGARFPTVQTPELA